MNSPAKFCWLTAWLFVFVVCLPVLGSLVLAQEIPPPGPATAGQNAPSSQALRRALVGGEVQAEELLRLIEMPAVQKALVLTDEQGEKIEDISFNVRRAVIKQQAALRVQRLELERMMRADTPDRAAIDKKVQEVAQALTEIMRSRVNALMDLRVVLTKEQSNKIRAFVSQRIQRATRARLQQRQPGLGLAPSTPTVPPAKPKQPLPQ